MSSHWDQIKKSNMKRAPRTDTKNKYSLKPYTPQDSHKYMKLKAILYMWMTCYRRVLALCLLFLSQWVHISFAQLIQSALWSCCPHLFWFYTVSISSSERSPELWQEGFDGEIPLSAVCSGDISACVMSDCVSLHLFLSYERGRFSDKDWIRQ